MTDSRVQVVLEEFGKWIKAGTGATLAERDEFYTAIYQEVSNVRMPALSHALLLAVLTCIRWQRSAAAQHICMRATHSTHR